MLEILKILAAELERPRELTAQVIAHLTGTYSLEREDLGGFLVTELPKLEDYEIDLILSPLFTPTLADQAVVAGQLGRTAIPVAEWPALVQQLVARPTRTQLITPDAREHSVPLRDVTIERFVHRLRLEATIPEPLFELIHHWPRTAERSLLQAIARRAVWETDGRRGILVRWLTAVNGGGDYQLAEVQELLKLAEIYQPADERELLAQIPHWVQVLRQEINESGVKPFFNERVEELHGGGRDQRRQNNSRVAAKESERAFLERLQRMLAG